MAGQRRAPDAPKEDSDTAAAPEGTANPTPEAPPAPPTEAPPSPLAERTGPKVVDGASDGSVGGPPPAPRDPELPPRPGFFVAPGKSITSQRGILGPTEEVWPRDFLEGEKTLEHLVAYKYVIEQK